MTKNQKKVFFSKLHGRNFSNFAEVITQDLERIWTSYKGQSCREFGNLKLLCVTKIQLVGLDF